MPEAIDPTEDAGPDDAEQTMREDGFRDIRRWQPQQPSSSSIEAALAEIRAIPMRETSPEPDPEPTDCPFSCTGDERGYQWHQRNGNLPACKSALEAHRLKCREYLREWRKRRPDYRRNWLAKQRTTGGAA